MSFKSVKPKVQIQESAGPQFPTIQWINGNRQMKPTGGIAYTGGFFIVAEKTPDGFEPPTGFKAAEITFSTGKAEIGYASETAEIAFVRARRGWLVENGVKKVLPWDQYQDGAKSIIQVLCAVRGCPSPLVLSTSGKSRSDMLKALFKALDERLMKAANDGRSKDERLPRLAFYLKVTSHAAVDPKNGFQTVGEGKNASAVTPMIAHLPDKIDDAYLDSKFVGDEAFELYQQWYVDAEAWAKEYDAPKAAPKLDGRKADDASGDDGGANIPF